MSVNDKQKKAMGAIMAAMNRTMSGNAAGVTESATTDKTMRDIMSRFRAATDNIRETAQSDDMLMEALQTERTDDGVRISEWNIVITEQAGRRGKFYEINNSATGSKIATDLRLYEAALMLTQELNKGASITSPKVRKILTIEEEFSKNLEDAAHFAHIAKVSKGEKKAVAEARHSSAYGKALYAKQEIKNVR